MEVTGTNLPATGVELILDGVQQTALAVPPAEAGVTQRFRVSGILDSTVTDIVLRMPDGYPEVADPGPAAELASLSFAPTFFSITPDLGSECGTVVTVKGTGWGINSNPANSPIGLRLKPSNIDLCEGVVSGTGGVEILGHGEFRCQTRDMTATPIAAGDAMQLVVVDDNQVQ